jgi:D-glycerate 3-kinase
MPPLPMPDPDVAARYHAPLAAWCALRVARRTHRRCWVLGIQGPQGCGKSTLAAALVEALGDRGLRAVTVSIDDFYLTHTEQRALAARHPGNPFLLYRGYPGTHDVALGARVIESVIALGPGDEAVLPAYDKSAQAGRGDRAPQADWRRVVGPLDALIVEGWMLGFTPVDPEALAPSLRAPNALLAEYAAWTRALDAFLRLDVASLETIVTWRVDAERARRARGEGALDETDARDYAERFLPAYRAYLPGLSTRPPCDDVREIALGEDRMPLALHAWDRFRT